LHYASVCAVSIAAALAVSLLTERRRRARRQQSQPAIQA
jgi:hypothetical protein